MELVEGRSAEAVLRERGAMPWPQATGIIAAVCSGLAAAHAAGLIHRDIKPANILLGKGGGVKLTDFGLVKAPRQLQAHATHPGMILGTPQYMSPEQCAGESIDERSDCYALGATYYALLTGRPPYDHLETVKVLYAHVVAPIPDPRSSVPELPEGCAAIVGKAMAKKRADRFRSPQEMLTELTALLGTRPADLAVPEAVAAPVPATAIGVGENTPTNLPVVLASQPPAARPRGRRFALAGAVVLVVGLIGAIGYFLARSPGDRKEHPLPPPFPQGQRVTLQARLLLGKHDGEARGPAFGGRRLASVGADKLARVWDLDHLEVAPRIFKHEHVLTCAALTPDGKRLATGNLDGTIVSLWDVDTGKEIGTIKDASGPWSLAFHPSGRRLAIGSGNQLQLIDLDADGKESKRQRLPGEQWVFTGVAFTPDGRHLGGTTFKPGAYLLDGATLQEIAFLPSTEEIFAGLSFSADGRRMAFGKRMADTSQELQLWDLKSDQQARCVTVETGGAGICAVAFAPGDRQIAHGGTFGGPIKLHDLVSGQAQLFPTNVNGNVYGLGFSPDGRLLAATCSEGSVLAWDVVQDK
jgi:hypothetical protein